MLERTEAFRNPDDRGGSITSEWPHHGRRAFISERKSSLRRKDLEVSERNRFQLLNQLTAMTHTAKQIPKAQTS